VKTGGVFFKREKGGCLGSGEHSVKILVKHLRKHPKSKFLRQSNVGGKGELQKGRLKRELAPQKKPPKKKP